MDQAAVLHDPRAAARELESLPNVKVARLLDYRAGVEFDLELSPPRELREHGYDLERARVLVHRRAGADPCAWPRGARRKWKHRNPRRGDPDEHRTSGTLCLWYPEDPDPLRWTWSDGLSAFVIRVQRHLLCEEFWRREDRWPVEDAPHGQPAHGVHPIRSAQMKKVVTEWERSRSGSAATA
jgi:hypothetical protein